MMTVRIDKHEEKQHPPFPFLITADSQFMKLLSHTLTWFVAEFLFSVFESRDSPFGFFRAV